ncbi:MAG: hybrid sensor histidine kinase/response regulator [Sandaracinaceae bacterium]
MEGPPGGEVRVLAGVGDVQGLGLTDAVTAMLQLEEPPPALVALLDRAQAGAPGSERLADRTVFAWPAPTGVRVMLAPDVGDGALVRRAAAADMAAGVTHELANALTAIAGWTRMASTGGPLPDRTREALDVVQRSARGALDTARGLLRTMRDADGHVLPSRPDDTDVGAVIHEVLETLRPELEEASITLETDLSANVIGTAPPAALRLVVSNLVRNAFEALDEGGTIRVEVDRRGERFVLTVADDGPGMAKETLAQAFDRYFTTKRSGTGLGLALVRDTVHEAGGRLEVFTREGRGTRFDVWLPLAGTANLSMRPPRVSTASSGVHPKPVMVNLRVLVVDDDAGMRSMMRTALEIQGAQVTDADGYESAIALEGPFDLALVDLNLGDGRGDELIGALRADERVERAVLLSGSADVELGATGDPDAVLRKPFELEDLHQVIERVVGNGSLEAEG